MMEKRNMRAQEWRKRRQVTKEITFPSGLTAMVRPMDISALLRIDREMPDYVTSLLSEFVNGNVIDSRNVEYWRGFYGLCEELARAMFVSPRIVDEPRDDQDEISPKDIGENDLLWLFTNLVGKPIEQMSSFRQEQSKPVDTVEYAESDGDAS
jgi:hypothetical protein